MSNRPQRDESEWVAPGIGDLGATTAQLSQFAARNQAELLKLFSGRASAYLEFPARLSQCRSLADLWREQLGFLTAMQRQYFEATQHLLEPLEQRGAEPQPRDDGAQAAPKSSPETVSRGTQRDPGAEQGTPRAA